MGEKEVAAEEDKSTPRGRKRKRGDSEITAIATFVEEKF